MSHLRDSFDPVEKTRTLCPVCGRDHYCMVAKSGAGVICTKIESDRRWGEAGWYHGPQRDAGHHANGGRLIDLGGELSADFTKRLDEFGAQPRPPEDEYLVWLGDQLGVSSHSLARLGFGRTHPYDWFSPLAATFTVPMRHGGNADKVVGIQTRTADGRKFTIKGSNLGLFIPEGVTGDKLYIVEGATDAAAGLDLGLPIVGRASATHGGQHLQYLIAIRRIRSAVIIADNDQSGVGLDGARKLHRDLRRLCAVNIVMPPAGTKDLRAWKQAGCSRNDILKGESQ